jgi:hypothetical protein
MVRILKIQLGRLWVFSCFLLFEISFEALFMWGLGCIEAEFLLIQFPMHWEFFFHTKRMGEGMGIRKKSNFLTAICD